MTEEINKITSFCFSNNVRMMEESCKDLTQAQSLVPMSFGHNCVNWTLGHLLSYRKFILKVLGDETLNWPKEFEDIYDTGNSLEESSQAAAKGVKLEILLRTLKQSQEILEASLRAKDLAEFTGNHEFFGGMPSTPKSIVEFLLWHESTHAGEINVQAAAAKQPVN